MSGFSRAGFPAWRSTLGPVYSRSISMPCFVVINHNTDALANIALFDLEETASTTAHDESLLSSQELTAIPHHFAAVPGEHARSTRRLPDYFGREMHARCATSPNPRSPGRGVFQAAVLFAPLSLQSPRHAVWYSRRKRRVFVHSLRLRKAVLQLTPILRSARKLRTSEAALQSSARYGRLAF
jgi:hypothetical protein